MYIAQEKHFLGASYKLANFLFGYLFFNINVGHRQRRYGDAARARRRDSWSNQVRKRGASPRKHRSSDGD